MTTSDILTRLDEIVIGFDTAERERDMSDALRQLAGAIEALRAVRETLDGWHHDCITDAIVAIDNGATGKAVDILCGAVKAFDDLMVTIEKACDLETEDAMRKVMQFVEEVGFNGRESECP